MLICRMAVRRYMVLFAGKTAGNNEKINTEIKVGMQRQDSRQGET